MNTSLSTVTAKQLNVAANNAECMERLIFNYVVATRVPGIPFSKRRRDHAKEMFLVLNNMSRILYKYLTKAGISRERAYQLVDNPKMDYSDLPSAHQVAVRTMIDAVFNMGHDHFEIRLNFDADENSDYLTRLQMFYWFITHDFLNASKILPEKHTDGELRDKLLACLNGLEDNFKKYILANWRPMRMLGAFKTDHLVTTSIEKRLIEHVQTTSLLKGGYKKAYEARNWSNIVSSSYWYLSGGVKEFVVDEVTDMALSVALFAHCPDVPTAILLLLKQMNRIYNITELIPTILSYCKQTANIFADYIDGLVKEPSMQTPRQQARGASVETTSDIFTSAADAATILDFFKTHGDSAASLISILGSVVFACVTVSLGYKAFKVEQTASIFKRLGNVGMAMSGIKRGIHAFIDMLKGIDTLARECVAWILGRESQNRLMSIIRTWDVEDEGEFVKDNFMELVSYLIDPKNTFEINGCMEKKNLLEKCDEVVNGILAKNTIEPLGLSKESLAWLLYARAEMKKVRTGIFRYPSATVKRFVPYWINIYGEKGVGKSEIMTTLSNVLCSVLYHKKIYGFRSDPTQDIYAQNCTDKYMPAYNGQNIVNIDDIFQDASSSNNETSSALKMIAYIAGVPYSIVQASLDEKGMQFKSKIVVTTTNSSIPNRKEIVDQGALLTRIRKMINIRWKHGVCTNCKLTRGIDICARCAGLNDEWFQRPIEAVVLNLNDSATQWIESDVLTGKQMVKMIVKEFEKYHALQEQLLSRAMQRDPLVDEILNDVETTSGFSYGKCFVAEFAASVVTGCYRYGVNDYLWRNTGLSVRAISEAFQLKQLYARLVDDYAEHMGYLRTASVRTHLLRRVIVDGDEFDLLDLVDIQDAGLKHFCQQVNEAFIQRRVDAPGVDFRSYLAVVSKVFDMELSEIQRESQNRITEAVNMWNASLLGNMIKVFVSAFLIYIAGRFIMCICSKFTSCELHTTSAKYNVDAARARPVRVFVGRPNQVETTSDKLIYAAQIDTNAQSLLQNVILKSGVVCNMRFLDGKNVLCSTCVRVKGPWIMFNAHSLPAVKDGDIMEIDVWSATGTKTVKQVFDSRFLRNFGDDGYATIDAVLYKCDSSMPSARDITNHFLRDSVTFATTEVAVCESNPLPHIVSNTFATPIVEQLVTYNGKHGGEYSMLSQYQVPMETSCGRSGSLLMANNIGFQRKLLGIQTARYKNLAYFQPITENMLRKAMGDDLIVEDIDEDEFVTTSGLTLAKEPHAMLGENGLRFIGELPKDKTIIMSKRSKLRPSVIFDEDNVTQEPSVLADNDDRMDDEVRGQSVVFRNMKGFDGQSGYIQRFVLSLAVAWLSKWYAIKQQVRGIPNRLLTDFEMVNGSGTLLKQLDMRTSPGVPFVWERKKPNLRGKFEWFKETIQENGAKVYEMLPYLRDKLLLREEMAKQGKRVDTLAYACLKDETRPIEKIKKGKTRVFLCMPMDYNMLIRKYFGTFIMMMHKQAGSFIAPCVGVDPCVGWTGLVRRMKAVGQNFEDFDYAGWDTMIHPDFIEAVADIVNAWYDDGSENARVRKVLMRELAHTMVVVKNKVFVKSSGQVSGCAITAESNSIVNELLMLYCWIILSDKYDPDMCNFEDYVANCQLGVYGDDIVKSVSEKAKWFNGNNIKTIVEETGMKMTTGDKTENFGFIALERMSFLKRSFVDEGYGRYTAPLRKDIIDNITQWIHRCDMPAEATMVNVRTAARNYALWGREDYDQFCRAVNKRISRAIRKGNVDLMPVTETYDRAMSEIQLIDL